MPLLPKSSLCVIKWIQRLYMSTQIQNPCSFSTSSSQLGNFHPVSQVTEILVHIGLLLDLSRLPPGWQVWSLSQTLCYLFCGSSRTLHLESRWVGVPCPSEEESHVKAKLRGGDSEQSLLPCHLVPTALLSPHGSSLFTPEAAFLQVGLCPLKWQLLLMMLQVGEAGTCVSSGCCRRRPWL